MNPDPFGSLQAWLEESSLSMQVFNECPPPDGRYVVWLFAADDPALGTFVGHDDDLALAIDKAVAKWSKGRTVANVHKARKKARANR